MTAPHGFQRTTGGWLEATPDPKKRALAGIKKENKDLKNQLAEQAALYAELAAKVDGLVAGKKGKK